MSWGDVRADAGVSSARQIGLSTIKRNPLRLVNGAAALEGHIGRFLAVDAVFRDWRAERVAIVPESTRRSDPVSRPRA